MIAHLQSFKEFPPRQKAATFGIDQVMDKLTTGGTGSTEQSEETSDATRTEQVDGHGLEGGRRCSGRRSARVLGDRGRRSIERPAAVVERRAGQAGDPRVRRGGDHRRRRRLRAARGPHRHLRPGRHAVGRAPDLYAGRVRARPGRGACPRASGVEDDRAVQDGALGRQGGDGQADPEGPGGDRLRDPCRDERGGVRGDRRGVGREGEEPALGPALHRAWSTSRWRRC